MKEKTERDILIEITRRLGLLIEEFTTEREISISSYYDIKIEFDDAGNVIAIDSHP